MSKLIRSKLKQFNKKNLLEIFTQYVADMEGVESFPMLERLLESQRRRITKAEKEVLRKVVKFDEEFPYAGIKESIIAAAWDYSNNLSGLGTKEIASAMLDYLKQRNAESYEAVVKFGGDENRKLIGNIARVLKAAGMIQTHSTRHDFHDRKLHWRRSPEMQHWDFKSVMLTFNNRLERFKNELQTERSSAKLQHFL